MPPSSLYERIYALVSQIPPGQVASYGQIAKLVTGAGARQVGYAMAALPEGSDVPWHRVVNSRGEISPRPGAQRQRAWLKAESVAFNAHDRIDLARHRWQGPDPLWALEHGLDLEQVLEPVRF